jgi:NhaP-type Na+/H+ or K+/H+ antiporter
LPVVMLALGLLGLHQLNGWQAAWYDLLWPIGGGVLFGLLLGRIGGGVLRGLLARGHKLAWDELVFLGGLLFSFGVARALGVSTFMTVFIAAASLLGADPADDTPAEAGLAERMRNFGERGERLVEVTIVLFLGAAMTRISWSLAQVGFALLLVLVVRPLSVWAVVRKARLSPLRRRLVAWFGIRGVGSLFYLVFAIEHGLEAPLAYELVGACVIAVALSIVTHGVSATPLMNWYQKRRRR